MTKFTLNREETIGKEHYNVAILAMYDTKEQAMAALYALAGVLGASVTFKADDLGRPNVLTITNYGNIIRPVRYPAHGVGRA